jgi:hypothetical protein
MKVINFESLNQPYGKEETLTMSTGHIAFLVQYTDGIESLIVFTKNGKEVRKNNTTWKLAEKAIWNTNPTRSKI